MITGLHHVQVTVPTGAEIQAREFYCGVLGLSEIPKPETLRQRGGLWLRVGHCDIHIGTEDDVDRRRTKAHVAYEVDDLAFWREKLRSEGIEIIEGVAIPGFERFEFRDPFGNRVEMIERIA